MGSVDSLWGGHGMACGEVAGRAWLWHVTPGQTANAGWVGVWWVLAAAGCCADAAAAGCCVGAGCWVLGDGCVGAGCSLALLDGHLLLVLGIDQPLKLGQALLQLGVRGLALGLW